MPELTITGRLAARILALLPECFVCPSCGPLVSVDEDGCCATCGEETTVQSTREAPHA